MKPNRVTEEKKKKKKTFGHPERRPVRRAYQEEGKFQHGGGILLAQEELTSLCANWSEDGSREGVVKKRKRSAATFRKSVFELASSDEPKKAFLGRSRKRPSNCREEKKRVTVQRK